MLALAQKCFKVAVSAFNEEQQAMLLMLHYDIWQKAGGFTSLEWSIRELGRNKTLKQSCPLGAGCRFGVGSNGR